MRRRLLSIAIAVAATAAVVASPAQASTSPIDRRHTQTVALPFRTVSMAGLRASVRRAGTPATNWTSLSDMRVAVAENGGAAFLNKRLYVPGGYTDYTTPTLYGHMQIYNSSTNRWTADAEVMPEVPPTGGYGWADAAVCTDGAKVYVIGGTNGFYIYGTMQIYDPGQPPGSRWSVGHGPEFGGHGLYSIASGCAWIMGKLYVFGGYGVVTPSTTEKILSLTWVYDPVTDTWSNTFHSVQGSPTVWFGYTASSSKAFFAGGTADIATRLPSSTAQVFSPATGWKLLPALPIPGGATQSGLLGPGMGMLGTTIEVIGGGGYNAVGANYIVQHATLQCPPGSGAWTDAGRDLNTARWFAATSYQSGAGGGTPTLYAAGGGPPGVVIKSAESTT